MAADVVAQPSNFWSYDSFTQLLSRFRPGSFFDTEYGYARTDQSTFICDLPEEVVIKVLQFLSQSDLAKCERVCKSWMHVIRSAGAQLWHRADISLQLESKYTTNYSWPPRPLDQHQKLELYVQYLLQMKPRLSSLFINLNIVDKRAFRAIEFLISSGFCANLREVHAQWYTEKYNYFEENDYDHSNLHFNKTLELLVKHAPQIRLLRTQLNFGFDSLKWLDKFENLVELDVVCVPRVCLLMPWHIEKVLSKLTKLQVFRLQVTINCSQFTAAPTLFSFVSPTLKTLDLSYCINFIVSSFDLPNLEAFRAVDTAVYDIIRNHHNKTPCLFDALSVGCPKLRKLNDVSLSPKESAAGLSRKVQRRLNICFCSKNHTCE